MLAVASVGLRSPAVAQTLCIESTQVLVYVVDGASIETLLAEPGLAGLAEEGGAAILPAATDVVEPAFDPGVHFGEGAWRLDDLRSTGVGSDLRLLSTAIADDLNSCAGERPLVAIVSVSAPVVDRGGDTGAAIVVTGSRETLLRALQSQRATPRSLTSDSTRRPGVIASVDIQATIQASVGLPVSGPGSPVRVDDVPPPVALYRKHLQYRELSAPIQTGVGVWELGIGALALTALRVRRPGLLRLALGAILSLPVLFLALLLVGHLPTISYATVVPVLVASSAVAGFALLRVMDRSGVGMALAWGGGIGLGGLAVESLVGWTAAFAPMLGGSHLDGARFFGMPNVEIGLALGGATLVAARMRSTLAGAALLAVTGLWFGSPWLGSNLGASITLFASAGLWWGIRGKRGPVWTGATAGLCVAVGGALVVFAHRFLTDAPTHITRFAESGGGISGILEKVTDRLEIGLRLVADQPPALIPVVGTLVALGVVLVRPPTALRGGFALEPDARPASLAILLGSVVAYLANDTGAAALGLGFGTAMVVLLAVSLAPCREKMDA
jgi:hypothetical protein